MGTYDIMLITTFYKIHEIFTKKVLKTKSKELTVQNWAQIMSTSTEFLVKSVQSDKRLCCLHEETLNPWLSKICPVIMLFRLMCWRI